MITGSIVSAMQPLSASSECQQPVARLPPAGREANVQKSELWLPCPKLCQIGEHVSLDAVREEVVTSRPPHLQCNQPKVRHVAVRKRCAVEATSKEKPAVCARAVRFEWVLT